MNGAEVAPPGILIEDQRQQRAATLLRDVAYVIEAHFDILDRRFEKTGPECSDTDCAGKHLDMFNRRARSGQCFHQPCFGTREFPARFTLLEPQAPLPESTLSESDRNRNLGWMLHDIAFLPATKEDKDSFLTSRGKRVRAEPRFFNATLENGVLRVHPWKPPLPERVMILQSLYQLYHRLSDDPSSGLPPFGFSVQNITFRIVLKEDGEVVGIEDARQEIIESGRGGREIRKRRAIELIVPGQTKSPGQGINPCSLWDNLTYLCGCPQPDQDPAKAEKNRLRAVRCFEGSKIRHTELFAGSVDLGLLAVARYFERNTPESLSSHIAALPEDARAGNGVFQIQGNTSFAHDGYTPSESSGLDTTVLGQCLISGTMGPIARLHEPKIKTFDPKGSLLVSFNERAYESYGKLDAKEVGQGRNAPVSEVATFGYCNALNWLLSKKNRRFRIGDATTVFWTGRPSEAESIIPWMLSGVPDAEDDLTRARVHAALERIARGTIPTDELGDPSTSYYILGLSPNSARLSVRFWLTGTLGSLLSNLKLHFNDLSIVRQWDSDPVAPSTYRLLQQTARDADGIPPLLGGALIRAILLGTLYPEALFQRVMSRIRVAETDPRTGRSLDRVTYLRAAILKAYLNRNHHLNIPMCLDPDRNEPSYLLGRLFAVLEKTQEDALPGINATICDRFYSSASATPGAVFPRILRAYQHNLSKLEGGLKVNRDKLVQEILGGLQQFPAHLNLQQQGQFAIGYYHQRKDFFTKKDQSQVTSD